MKTLRLTGTNVDVQTHKLDPTNVNGYSIILTDNSAIPSALSIVLWPLRLRLRFMICNYLKTVNVSTWAGIMFTFTVMLILRWQAQ